MIKDRITDNMFQQVLTRTEDYDIIATTNLNGDYLSDALAAQVGGLGIAPSVYFMMFPLWTRVTLLLLFFMAYSMAFLTNRVLLKSLKIRQ